MVKNILWRLVKELWFPLLCLWVAFENISSGKGEAADRVDIILCVPVVLMLTFYVIYDEYCIEKKLRQKHEEEKKKESQQ